MKTKQNLIQIWLLCAAMLPAVVQAQFTFTTNNGAITITGYTGSGGAVTIPGTVGGLPVTSIGTNAFSGCSGLSSVIMPNSVVSIGSHAFSGCTNLLSIFWGGNAPNTDPTAFTNDNNASVYYLPGTTGWSSTFGGIQTVLLPYYYTINSGVITITSYTGSSGAAIIPSVIGGLPVTSIGRYAFQNCSPTSVTIPDSVTNIGILAFANCSNLTSATIGNGVTSIPGQAFINCTNLISVTIGNGVININDVAFYNCGLASITIPNSVIGIWNDAFGECDSLTNVIIGNSVTYIEYRAFADCTSLKGVYYQGNTPSSVDSTVFLDDTNAVAYYLPGTTGWGPTFDGLPTALWNLPVPYNYTTNNGAITITGYTGSGGAVTIPSAIYVADAANFLPVTSIGPNAFSGCTNLISVVIPNGVTNIGSHAFSGCTNLLGVFFGSNAPGADSTVFAGDTNALAYYLPGITGWSQGFAGIQAVLLPYDYMVTNGTMTITGYTGPGGAVTIPSTIGGLQVTSIGNEAFYNCTNLNSVTIADGVTNIGHGAFASCINLTSVTIPNSVTSIGICAFWNCTSLTSVTLSTNATSIGASDFDGCTSLTSVTIPNNVLNIGSSAFQNCSSLTNITIGSGVTSIGNCAFDSCGNLTAIMVDPQNFNYGSVDGVLLNKNRNTLIQCPGGKAGSYTVPNSITNIGNFAFDSCASLTSITISNSVKSIGDSAFDSCTSLTSVTIGSSVTSIGDSAFDSCTSLTSVPGVTFPNSITSIGFHAFDGCSGLTKVTIPASSITSIRSWAFSDCTGLATVTIGASVTSIGAGAFFGCTSLTNVTIWNFTSIGISAFDCCTNLTEFFFRSNPPLLYGAFVLGGGGNAIVYYLPGTTGWGTTLGGLPTALWLPQVQTGDVSFGIHANQFGFNINWASYQTVLVEATTNLVNPVWSLVAMITLMEDGSSYFSDPQWTNYPNCFYRVRPR